MRLLLVRHLDHFFASNVLREFAEFGRLKPHRPEEDDPMLSTFNFSSNLRAPSEIGTEFHNRCSTEASRAEALKFNEDIKTKISAREWCGVVAAVFAISRFGQICRQAGEETGHDVCSQRAGPPLLFPR